MAKKIKMGYWKCAYCGEKDIPGPELICPVCNFEKPADVVHYLKEESPVVTDPKELERAQAGPNWVCDWCGAQNPNTKKDHCFKCFHPRVEGEDKSLKTRDYPFKGGVPRTPEAAARISEKSRRAKLSVEKSDLTFPSFPKRKLMAVGKVLGIAALAGLLMWAVWFFFIQTHEVVVTVNGFSWERTIDIEKERTVQEEGWSVPSGGREILRTDKIKEYETVITGYRTESHQESREVADGTEEYKCGTETRDLGNGYFSEEDKYCTRTKYKTEYYSVEEQVPITEQRPVYATWYTYEIDKWFHERTERASGNGNAEKPYWPEISLGLKERESFRSEQYTVYFLSNEEEPRRFSRSHTQHEWENLEKGMTFVADVNRAGMILSLRDPE